MTRRGSARGPVGSLPWLLAPGAALGCGEVEPATSQPVPVPAERQQLVVIGSNLRGAGLRDVLDPRLGARPGKADRE